VQDESSLGALTQCQREHACNFSKERMVQAFLAALSHPQPNARLLATYSDYAWNVLDDHELGLRMAREAAQANPDEPAYLITLVRMLAASGRRDEARQALAQLERLNIANRLATSLAELRSLPGVR
jgi:Flp pilus assembly protein TadD